MRGVSEPTSIPAFRDRAVKNKVDVPRRFLQIQALIAFNKKYDPVYVQNGNNT